MQLIGIAGKAQHGKDTICQILAPYGYHRFAFAARLKTLALASNPFIFATYAAQQGVPGQWGMGWVRLKTLVQQKGWDEAKKHPHVRQFLQDLGVGVREEVGENAWLDRCLADIRCALYEFSWERFSISDVRFNNEAEAIHKYHGGVVWEVINPRIPKVNDHCSEDGVHPSLIHHTFMNDGTIEDLEAKVGDYLSQNEILGVDKS